MQEIFLIDAYLDDEKKTAIFMESMSRLRDAGFKIFLLTNSRPTLEVLAAVDYCFFDEENRKFKTEFDEYPVINVFTSRNGLMIRSENLHKQKHSLSVHVNMYRGYELLKSLGYTHCYRMEYDGLISSEDMVKIKEIPSRLGDKKALFYADKNNKHIFYHLWYSEVDWMLKNLTPIRNEEDFINRTIELIGSKKFLPAEEYLMHDLKNVFHEAIVLETVDGSANSEFPTTRWNCIVSNHTDEKFKNGFYGGVFRIAKDNGNGLHLRGDKGAVVAWHLQGMQDDWVEVKFFSKEGEPDGHIKIELKEQETWKVQFFEFSEDCEVEVRSSNVDAYTFLMCKNFLAKTKDTVILDDANILALDENSTN